MADRLSGAMNASLDLPGTIWVELDRYRELETKYEAAQKTLEEYRLEQDKFDRLKMENDLLRKELKFDVIPDYPEIKARVLGVRINSISPRIIINKGTNDGVKPFMPVIVRTQDQNNQLIRTVVGIIASADATTSIVQPVSHPGFRLGVRIPESGQWAILSGNSSQINHVLLTYLANDGSPDKATYTDISIQVKKNSQVVTSGAGGIFPPGIPVGYILTEGNRENEFKTAYVKTYANISELDILSIIKKNPEKWKENMDHEFRWDEHLLTEFGKAVYPEGLSKKKKPVVTKPAAKPANTQTNTRTGSGSTKPSASTQPENIKTNEKPEEAPKPRRINNLNLPGSGGN